MKQWSNITIEDYQHIYGIIIDENLNDFEKEVKLVALINELNESEVDNLSIEKFNELKTTIQFLHNGELEAKATNIIKANGKRYELCLYASKITYGQYVDLTSFMSADGGLIGNLHLILASICKPLRKKWFSWVSGKYGDVEHSKVAEDMLKANFADAYGASVFFWKLTNDLTKTTVHYSIKQLMREKKLTKHQVRELLKPLKVDGDGYTMQNFLKDLRELR